MTDREVMTAIYAAIEKLYLDVTGKPLSVSVETSAGVIKIKASEPQARLA